MFYKEYMNYDISFIYYGIDIRVFLILIGLVFYFLFKNKKLDVKKVNILFYIFLVVIVFIVLLVDYLLKFNYYGFLYLISVLGVFIIVISLKIGFLDFKSLIMKLLFKLGEYSYVYYLW